LEDSDMPTMKQ